MRTFAHLVTLLALFGQTESRLGGTKPSEITLPDQQEVARSTTEDEGEHATRDLQQGEGSFYNPSTLDENDNFIRVMVGFKNENGRAEANIVAGRKWMREMNNIKVASMLIPRASLESLRTNPNIEYVEEDGIMTPDSESVPYGISMTKGDSSLIPTAQRSSSACSDPNSFKVAIIDSGVQVGHPDIPCLPIDDPNTNCKGTSIGTVDLWYDPKGSAGHGTHVFGTIGAIGGNDEGVTGMLPDSDGICYLIARVIDDEGHGIYASSVIEAIDWAVSEGANVINMSLSGETYFQAGQDAVASAYANGALSVASAGNSGMETFNYPASFDHVISVAAVDTAGSRAYFSSYNNQVDVAAPGVNVISTSIGGRYSSMDGTSMAAPHVTGAIAKVWSVCSQCSNAQVESCLFTTSSSSNRRTKQLGFGIINAADTYDCLVSTDGCCAETMEPELIEQDRDPEAATCNRRAIGERCTRDAYCCSGNCDVQTCQAA